ncbi:type 4 pilus major pilin [Pseudomonas siliginis]|uniref:type 4 pilus major pilin n=1 Tax=Pseudomonas siliginis TaxID=2842346 RepID=UPI0020923246|nr:type 4 pilus major pilin [Pseudomonas siliginis]UST77201.1 pilus assembly protein PilX [Pseudomonas siliginis]
MKINNHNRLHKQSGTSNMEMLFYFIIAALVLVGAVALGMKLFGKQTNSSEQAGITNLIINTRALKGSQGYGPAGTDLTSQLIVTEGIPDTFTVTGGVIYNAWGGVVSPVSTGPAFTLTTRAVPPSSCVALSTAIGRTRAYTTKINSGTATTGEVTSGVASASCDSDSNTVAWTVSQ